MELHKAYCLFKPVRCPKAMFSLSCNHTGPVCTIQQHGRDKHNLHYGVTDLELGVISSKMFDISADKTCCEDIRNAKYQVRGFLRLKGGPIFCDCSHLSFYTMKAYSTVTLKESLIEASGSSSFECMLVRNRPANSKPVS